MEFHILPKTSNGTETQTLRTISRKKQHTRKAKRTALVQSMATRRLNKKETKINRKRTMTIRISHTPGSKAEHYLTGETRAWRYQMVHVALRNNIIFLINTGSHMHACPFIIELIKRDKR